MKGTRMDIDFKNAEIIVIAKFSEFMEKKGLADESMLKYLQDPKLMVEFDKWLTAEGAACKKNKNRR